MYFTERIQNTLIRPEILQLMKGNQGQNVSKNETDQINPSEQQNG